MLESFTNNNAESEIRYALTLSICLHVSRYISSAISCVPPASPNTVNAPACSYSLAPPAHSVYFLEVCNMGRGASNFCPRSSMPPAPDLASAKPVPESSVEATMKVSKPTMTWQQQEDFGVPVVSGKKKADAH